MAFDRSKYKKASVESIDETVGKAAATMGGGFGQGGRASFFNLNEDGRYVLRVLPSLTGKPYMPRKTVKLPIECAVYDKDGKDTGKKEIRQKDVFTSDIHSNRMNGEDAVLTYISHVYNLANDIQDKEERAKFLYPISGYRNKQKQWIWGMKAMLNYVAYVWAENDVYRLDLRPDWWKKMKNISMERAGGSDDGIINLDIFSDPDEGYPLIVNVTTDENKKKNFDITCGMPDANKRQTWDDFFAKNRVSDEVFGIMEELPTLDDMYVDVFSCKDWDMQLEGLERIDEEQSYGIFQDDVFLNKLEELDKLVPEEDEIKEKKAPKKAPETKKVKTEEPKEEPTKTEKKAGGYPTLTNLKKELRAYIADNYEDKELPEELTVAELRKWYDIVQEGGELPFEDYEEPEDEEQGAADPEPEDTAVEEREASASVPNSIASRLRNLKARTSK